jgi:hypothetical protein
MWWYGSGLSGLGTDNARQRLGEGAKPSFSPVANGDHTHSLNPPTPYRFTLQVCRIGLCTYREGLRSSACNRTFFLGPPSPHVSTPTISIGTWQHEPIQENLHTYTTLGTCTLGRKGSHDNPCCGGRKGRVGYGAALWANRKLKLTHHLAGRPAQTPLAPPCTARLGGPPVGP